MARFRRISFEDPQGLLPAASLPSAALPFVQQLRLFLAGDSATQRRTAYAAVLHHDTAVLWLDAKNDRMMTTAPASVALALMQRLLSENSPPLSLTPVSEEVFMHRAVVSGDAPMRPTLWEIGLQAPGDGTLMAPLQDGTKLRLRRWPDFRILAHRHDHFRICALLIKQGASVQACCEILDMPRHQVQSFFNAAFLTAYAFPVMAEEAPPRRSPTDGLANLWRQLRLHWSA